MKKSIGALFTVLLLMAMMPMALLAAPASVDEHGEGCGHDHSAFFDEGEEYEWVWEREETVYVLNEEEFLAYPKDPVVKYTFIFTEETPSVLDAFCYACGKAAMSQVTYIDQIAVIPKMCPILQENNDIFIKWGKFAYERCTACGYRSEAWRSGTSETYTAQCLNGDTHWSGNDWEVRYEYTQAAGYNLHQSLRWWTDKLYD